MVNTTADDFGFDDGTTSLREAIAGANAVPGQTITFDPTVFASAQTITLSLGQLELSDTQRDRDDHGPGGGRDDQRRRERAGCFRSTGNVTASISGLTITDGNANNGGGLADYGGTATLTDCTVSGNSAAQWRRPV